MFAKRYFTTYFCSQLTLKTVQMHEPTEEKIAIKGILIVTLFQILVMWLFITINGGF